MRIFIKRFTGWLHASLILSLIIPLLYALSTEPQDLSGQALYLKCLAIALPVVMTDFASNRCKYLLSYLMICALTFAATGLLGWCIAGALHQSAMLWPYIALLLVETMFVIISRLVIRLHRKKNEDAAKGEDPGWRPEYDLLREPSFMVLIYFAAVYTAALNLNNPALCNAALISAALYVPVTMLYEYICETENYLSLNKRTCSLPSRRIYGIGGGILAIFMLVFVLSLLPAFLTISHRHYRDLRKWAADIEIDYTQLFPENQENPAGEDAMAALIAEYGEPVPTPQWLILLSYILEIAIVVFFVVILFRKVLATFQDFRSTADENGDIIEELEDHTKELRQIAVPINRTVDSERERIRRKYRKVIRRHRKDRPAAYESPSEIETAAGIADNEEGKKLHILYESARYGKDCPGHD